MMRKLAFLLALGAICFTQGALALGLGEARLNSALNEPLNAVIEVVSVKPGGGEDLKVTLATSDDFRRAGLDRPHLLSKLRFRVVEEADGTTLIRVTTSQPVREPFLNFLMEVNWPEGRVLREYTLLLDPPIYGAAASQGVKNIVREDVQTALSTTPKATGPQPGSKEWPKPVFEGVGPVSLTSADQAQPAPKEDWPQPVFDNVHPVSLTGAGASEYGPVGASDTLWSISNSVRPAGVSNQQMMLAILRANPEAFSANNINSLKRGQVLRIPGEAEIQAVDKAEALQEAKRQNAEWDDLRMAMASGQAGEPTGTAMDEAPSVEAEPADRVEILSAGKGEAAVGGVAGGAQDASALRSELSLVQEELDSKQLENEELRSRLAQLEDLNSSMDSKVELQSNELTMLRQRLMELETGEAPMEEPEVLVEVAPEMVEEPLAVEPEPMEVEPEPMMVESEPLITEPEPGMMEPDPLITEPEPGMMEPEPLVAEPEPTMMEPEMLEEPAPAVEEVEPVVSEEPRVKPVLPPPPAPKPTSTKDLVMGQLDNLKKSLPVDPMILGGGLLVVLLLLVMLMIRRRKAAEEEEDMPFAAYDTATDDAETVIAAAEQEEEDEDRTQVAAEEPEEELEAMGVPVDETEEEEDPLAEVNVYLAYERFDQAEALVRKAINDYPERDEYKLKILEIHYAAKNLEGFEQDAADLRDAAGIDSPLMEKAAAWWEDLSPERELFAEGVPAKFEETHTSLKAPAAMAATAAGEELAAGEDIDFDLGLTSEGETDQALDEVAAEGADMDLDLGLGEAEEGEAAAEGEELDLDLGLDTAEPSAEEAEEGGELDLDLGLGEADAGGEQEEAPMELDIGLDDVDAAAQEEGELDLGEAVTEAPGDEGEELDLDLGDVDETAEEGELDLGEAIAEAPGEEGGDLDLDLGLGEVEAVEPEAAEEAVADEDSDGGDLDLDLGLGELGEAEPEAAQEGELALDEVAAGEAAEDGGLDLDLGLEEAAEPEPEVAPEGDLELSEGAGEGAAADGAPEEELDLDIGLDDVDTGEGAGDGAEKAVEAEAIEVSDDESLEDLLGFGEEDSTSESGSLDVELDQLDTSSEEGDAAQEEAEIDLETTMDEATAEVVKGSDESDLDSEMDDDLNLAIGAETEESGELGGDLETELAAMADLAEESEGDAADSSDLDLDLGIGDSEAAEGAAEAATDEEGPEIDFDLDLDEPDDGEKTLALGREMSGDVDEIGTKLDLAQAYIDMGDAEGAKGILEEVISEGSEEQQSEAKELMEKLG